MITEDQIKRATPEELLVMITEQSARVTQAAANAHRFGWDLKFGTGTNAELLLEAKKDLDKVTKEFFLKTRREF